MVFRFVPPGDPCRSLVEAHVRRVYRETFGAIIRRFPRLMVAELDDAARVECAAALRRAGDGFFSECYLDAPLEDALGGLAGARVGRERIIEISNLASRSASSSARLFENIIAFARCVGTDWAVFTITPQLKRLLYRMKLPVVVLGPAAPSRVANPADWGRYYETGPVVAAIHDPGPPALVLPHEPVFAVSGCGEPSEPPLSAHG